MILKALAVLLVGPSIAAPSEAPQPPPVVSASSGAVQMTLRLHSRVVRVGEFPWSQITIKNVGHEDFVVFDDFFRDHWKLADSSLRRLGGYVEVEGPSGELLPASQELRDFDPREVSGDPVYPPEEKRRDAAMVAKWKKEGLTREEITRRLNELPPVKTPVPPKSLVLMPGKLLSTKPWHFWSLERARRRWTPPAGTEAFTELAIYRFFVPGKHRIRLVYDRNPAKTLERLSSGLSKLSGAERDLRETQLESLKRRVANPGQEEVSFATDWIEFEVRR